MSRRIVAAVLLSVAAAARAAVEGAGDLVEGRAFRLRSRLFNTNPATGGDEFKYIDNGVIRVGVDMTRGGAIGYLAASKNPKVNVINCHDMGREVQMSFYATPDFYNPGGKCPDLFQHRHWCWNPIGAGDIDGNHGTIDSFNITGNTIKITTTPLQWACHDVACECNFERTITIDGTPAGTGVKVTATLRNHRTDTFTPAMHGQELPAVYSTGEFYHLKSYTGDAPWTNAATQEFTTGGPPWVPGKFSATENWAALLNDAGWGMGVVNADASNPANGGAFIGGFAGTKGSGGPYDSQTGYIAPTKKLALGAADVYTYTFHLVLGNEDTIRSYAHQVSGH